MITTKVVLLIINYKIVLFYTIILIGQISSIIYKPKKIGRVAELVDALVLGTNMATCEGSSPFSPTIFL